MASPNIVNTAISISNTTLLAGYSEEHLSHICI